MVQSAAVYLLTVVSKYEHITQVLGHLHWLPVEARVRVSKIANGFAALYLSDLVNPYTPVCALDSQSSHFLSVPMVHKKIAGDWAYPTPTSWNGLGRLAWLMFSKLKTHLINA